MNNQMYQWASRYVKEGWSLIPICTPTKKGLECDMWGKGSHVSGHRVGKTPRIGWTEYRTRKASIEEVQTWLSKWPNMNLGVCTGIISRLVVVDLDGPLGAKSGRDLKLESSVKQLTGNGKHVFYKWTEHIDNSVKKLAPGVDIRGDGGYVVVPPSMHPNGRQYRWERFVPTMLTPLPECITKRGVIASVPIVTQKEPGWIAKALEGMKIGNIDDTLTSILGRMRRDGWADTDALRLLEPHAKAAGATDNHLGDKIRNIWGRYEPKVEQHRDSHLFSAMRNEQSLLIHSPNNDDSFTKFQLSIRSDNSGLDDIKTGFPTLDKYFEGGLKSERLFTIAARTGTGKTNFAIALAVNLCQQDKKVLFFSTEFQYSKIWGRYLSYLQSGISEFRKHAFYVCDSFSPNLNQVEEAIKEVKPDVWIFDHINHVGEERESLGTFMQGANFLQRKYNNQGIMVAQLNRQADWVENGKRIEPRMSMIKGSGTIEQASSRVLLLSETRVTPEYNEILGVLDKNDTGDKGIINFALYKNPYILKELV